MLQSEGQETETGAERQKGGHQVVKGLGLFACCLLATFLSGPCALKAAKAGGLQGGGWNLQFLFPVVLGWAVGGLVTGLTAVVLCRDTKSFLLRFLGILFAAPFIAYLLSGLVCFVAFAPERRRLADWRELQSEFKEDPGKIPELIGRARMGTLEPYERRALLSGLHHAPKLSPSDVQLLLGYAGDNKWVIAPLVKQQELTSEQLHALFERYIVRESRRPDVLMALAAAPHTPLTDLQALADPNTYVANGWRLEFENLVECARRELDRRNAKDSNVTPLPDAKGGNGR